MVDLSKQIQRAKQSLDRRQYDLTVQICEESLDLGPTEIELHQLLVEASRRKVKEQGLPSFLSSLRLPAFSLDPHKKMLGQIKRVGRNPDPKVLADAGRAAQASATAGNKGMYEIACFYFDEVLASGLFLADELHDGGQCWFERYKDSKDFGHLNRALTFLKEVERGDPTYGDVSRLIKNWEAMRSMTQRSSAAANPDGAAAKDFRNQLNNQSDAKKAEIMNRLVRSEADAKEVLTYLDEDLKGEGGQDKALWIKKGDLERRFISAAAARISYTKAKTLDAHDFNIEMRLDELDLDDAKAAVESATPSEQPAARKVLLEKEILSFRKRAERQPMDLSHRYNLGIRLIKNGDIDGAAVEFQRAQNDSKLKRGAHRYLGFCFTKKNLLDLAHQQYTAYLSLVEDDQTDEAKEVRYARARLSEDLGRKTDAIQDHERIVAIDLNYKDAAARLGKLRGVA
jgi:hypothetical protein